MTIVNKALNLVVPIERADKTALYIHSTPLRPETFATYYMVLAKAFSSFTDNGLDPRSGPAVAAMILRDIAKSTMRAPGVNWWDGDDGVGGPAGLMAEITRLSNAVVATPDGWKIESLQDAVNKKLVDEEEQVEVANILAFFTVVSLVAPRTIRSVWVNGLAAIYGLQVTYLSCMDFSASLATLTTAANTGEKEVPSSTTASTG